MQYFDTPFGTIPPPELPPVGVGVGIDRNRTSPARLSEFTTSANQPFQLKFFSLSSYPVLFNFKKLFNYDHVLKMFNDVVDMMEDDFRCLVE